MRLGTFIAVLATAGTAIAIRGQRIEIMKDQNHADSPSSSGTSHSMYGRRGTKIRDMHLLDQEPHDFIPDPNVILPPVQKVNPLDTMQSEKLHSRWSDQAADASRISPWTELRIANSERRPEAIKDLLHGRLKEKPLPPIVDTSLWSSENNNNHRPVQRKDPNHLDSSSSSGNSNLIYGRRGTKIRDLHLLNSTPKSASSRKRPGSPQQSHRSRMSREPSYWAQASNQ